MPDLNDHAALRSYGSGVSSADLADFTRAIAEAAATRIEGVGADQYDNDNDNDEDGTQLQKFETATIDKYVEELLDEVADINAYLAIICIKMLALRGKAAA